MHGTEADSGPLGAVQYLLAIEKSNWKKSAGYRLGFAVGAMERTLSFNGEGHTLSADEKTLINTAFTIFSSHALLLKAELRLTDSQMGQLFTSRADQQITGPLPFPG